MDPRTASLLDELAGPARATPSGAPMSGDVASLIDALVVSSPKMSKATIAPGYLGAVARGEERVARNKAMRKDLTPEAQKAWLEVAQGIANKDILRHPLRMGKALLATLGAAGQRGEAAVANLAQGMQEGKIAFPAALTPEASVQAIQQGLSGESKATFGDVFAGAGAGPGTSSALGFGTDMALNPVNYVANAAGTVGRAAVGARGRILAKGGYKGFLNALTGVDNTELVADAARTNFKGFSVANLRPNAEPAQALANTMISRAERLAHPKASAAFDKVIETAKSTSIPTKKSESIVASIERNLAEEGDQMLKDSILKTPVRKVLTVPEDKLTKVEKVATTYGKKPVTDFTMETRNAAGVKSTTERSVGSSPPALYKESTSNIVKEGTTPKYETITLGDLLERAKAGESTDALDWLNVMKSLRVMGKHNVRAADIVRDVGVHVESAIPGLADANKKWSSWTRLRRSLDTLTGGTVAMGEKGTTRLARDPNLINDYWYQPKGGVLRQAVKDYDAAMKEFLPAHTSVERTIKNVSAASRFASGRPRLTTASMTGYLGMPASHLGVPGAAVAGAQTGAILLGVPRLAAKVGKLAFGTTAEEVARKSPRIRALMRVSGALGNVGARAFDTEALRLMSGRTEE